MLDVVLVALGGVAALLLATANWRPGLLLAVAVGFLQDPMRKLAPGEPVYFVLFALLLAAVYALIPLMRRGIRLYRLFHGNRRLVSAILLFLFVVMLQALHSASRYNALMLTGLGVMFYTAPLLALWLGSQYARRLQDVRVLVRVYVCFALIAAITVVLSYLGMQSILFDEVGPGVRIYERTLGYYIEAHTGLMRSTEIAAWHIAAGACFLIILGVTTRKPHWIALCLIAALALLAITTLTGRRKAITLVVGFAVVYALMLWKHVSRSLRSTLLVNLAGGVGVVSVFWLLVADQGVDLTATDYLHRAGTVWEDIGERLMSLGFGSVLWAWQGGGLFGMGTGVAAQGAQHFGGALAGGAGEGGLGKILVELGLPGLVCFFLMLMAITQHYWRIVVFLRDQPPKISLMMYGLIAFLAANLPVFMVASQVYGDPFILLLLGLMSGFVLAAPQISARLDAAEAVNPRHKATMPPLVAVERRPPLPLLPDAVWN